MLMVGELLIGAASVLALVFSLFLFVEVVAGVTRGRSRSSSKDIKSSVVILIPAHNEAALISTTLSSVKAQLSADDKIVVVADNCTDDTAEIARSHGAICYERTNPTLRGKGYALQFGLDELAKAAPELIVLIDADCTLGDNALSSIVARAICEQRPVQALYLMQAGVNASPRNKVAEFAWMLMNRVRMSGLDRLCGASRVTGSGIAIPWPALEKINLATGEIVEDLALSFELTRLGHPVSLDRSALVFSEFPDDDAASTKQAARWSIGSLIYAHEGFLTNITAALRDRNFQLFCLTLDSVIPPLTVMVAIQMVILLAAGVLGLMSGASLGFVMAFIAMALTGGAISIAWISYGRQILPLSNIAGLGSFLLSKINIFGREGRETAKSWTPTRSSDENKNAQE